MNALVTVGQPLAGTTDARPPRDASVLLSAGLWIASRLLVVMAAVHWYGLLTDVRYWTAGYDARLGPSATMTEYPVPAYALLWMPWKLAEMLGAIPGPLYVLSALVADGAFHGALVRARRGRRGVAAAEWLWILAGPALGAVAVAHFDLAVGILLGLALLLASSRPTVAAIVLAVAVGLKYTPMVALPALLAHDRWRRRSVRAVAVAGSCLIVGSVVLAGISRLWSPLVWQSERGLQTESVAAFPALVARLWQPDQYRIALSSHQSFDVTGPHVELLTMLATVALGLFLLLCVALWWRARRGVSAEAMVWLTIAPVVGFVACNKVLSPQYLLWLTPMAAAGVAITAGVERRRLTIWAVGLLACCALTQWGPVLGLASLVEGGGSGGGFLVLVMLGTRNLAVVALAVFASARAWSLTAPTLSPASPSRPVR